MKESKRRRSLSGAVLIMILTVMFVLIILLTATLTTVTTANQRIYTKFEENQAYYTARSALDVFTQNMMADSNYYAGKKYNYTDVDVTPAVIVNNKDMKQGLALQFDLYKIHSQCETYGKNATSGEANIKWAENMTAANAASIFSATNLGVTSGGTPPEQGNFSISSTALNQETASSGKQFDYIEYQVTLPTLSDGSDEYGKFVDVDKTKTGNPQIAKIKVEVLDRVYATEPSYTSDQIKAYFGGDHSVISDDATLMSAIAKGSRSKDYMKLKVTSTVTVWGIEGISVVIIETNEKNTPATDQALTATGKFSGGGGAQARLMGGGATMDTGVSKVGDGNNMFGSIFSLGQLEWTSSAETVLNKNEFMVAMGGIAPSTNQTNVKAKGKGAFLLWGGTSELTQGAIGDGTNPISVFSKHIVHNGSNPYTFNGDVYVETFENKANNPGKVTVNSGNMYVKNLILDGSMFTVTTSDTGAPAAVTIDSNELNALKAKFCTGYSIKGTKSDGTTILITASGATVNGTNVTLNSTIDTVSKAAFDMNTFTIQKKDGKLYRRYENLPFNVDGKNYVDVPTAQAYFGEYFKNGAFHDETGELKDYNNQTNYSLTATCNEYSNIYSDTNKNKWLITGADMLADYLELPELLPGASARTISGLISDGKIPGVPAGSAIETMPTGTVDIDLSGGDKYYLLQGSYQNCTWTVRGNNGRLILLIPEDTNTHIIKSTGSSWEVGSMDYSAISSYTVTFDNCALVTEQIDIASISSSGVNNGTTKAPRIDIYGGTGSFFNTSNQNLICGYFMMPTGYFYLNNGKTSGNYTSGGVTTSTSNVAVVGSVLCNEFCESNQSGVLYLGKNSGAATPGEPHLNIQSSQYVRS